VPAGLLWVPRIALHCCKGQCVLILTADLAAGRARALGDWLETLARVVPALAVPTPAPLRSAQLQVAERLPDPPGWRSLVEEALAAIAAQRLEKVVLARRLRLRSERPFDAGRLAAALGYLFPACQMLRWQLGRETFVAATPERLLSLRGQRVEADAMAGTAGRAAQAARDAELAGALLASPKECREHQLVVDDIVRALAPLSTSIEVPPAPRVLQLNNAQHLWSPISATLAAAGDLFALAERLHPTPAVNGTPRTAALDWLAQREPFPRGWYTGAAGWTGPDLGGELWVLLRCAVLRDQQADLYAGAGLVAGSEPDTEWQETEDKLAAMLTALQFV
jgi:menaquinone-specific isochorismate synthase